MSRCPRCPRLALCSVFSYLPGLSGLPLPLAVTALPVWAAATVVRGTEEIPIGETNLTDECRPGITGELSGTAVTRFRSTETANGFHIAGTTTDTGRIDWSDGSYTLIGSINHSETTSPPRSGAPAPSGDKFRAGFRQRRQRRVVGHSN